MPGAVRHAFYLLAQSICCTFTHPTLTGQHPKQRPMGCMGHFPSLVLGHAFLASGTGEKIPPKDDCVILTRVHSLGSSLCCLFRAGSTTELLYQGIGKATSMKVPGFQQMSQNFPAIWETEPWACPWAVLPSWNLRCCGNTQGHPT